MILHLKDQQTTHLNRKIALVKISLAVNLSTIRRLTYNTK